MSMTGFKPRFSGFRRDPTAIEYIRRPCQNKAINCFQTEHHFYNIDLSSFASGNFLWILLHVKPTLEMRGSKQASERVSVVKGLKTNVLRRIDVENFFPETFFMIVIKSYSLIKFSSWRAQFCILKTMRRWTSRTRSPGPWTSFWSFKSRGANISVGFEPFPDMDLVRCWLGTATC